MGRIRGVQKIFRAMKLLLDTVIVGAYHPQVCIYPCPNPKDI
jgi:hypothetical protein